MWGKVFTKSSILSALALSISSVSFSASATTILDGYVGANDNGHGDVIGDTALFDTHGMTISRSGNSLLISIDSNFAGKGDDGLFGNLTNGNGIGYGDVFLSATWDPEGSAPYAGDDNSNGTVWSYGFNLFDRYMSENDQSNGHGTLYSLNSGNNDADILMSDDFLTSGIFRNGQEVAVDTVNGNVTALNQGLWNIDTANNLINFEIDISNTSLLASSAIAVHWGPTCANDVIEGVSPVPVPAAVWLFVSGMAGLFGLSVRRKSRN